VSRAGSSLACESGHSWPIREGTLRFVEGGAGLPGQEERLATAESFAYEWERFGDLRAEWERNFLDYMQPHAAEFFDGLRVLDAGAGSGRHSRQAALYGARVAAVDLGDSIDVARANTPDTVLTIQSDLEALPLAPGSFDFVMSIGVLHHLPDTERALKYLVQFARPGGRVRVYLYWQPERRWQRAILRGVSTVRRATTRMPHRLLHALCYPLAALLWVFVVVPYRALRNFPPAKGLADALPLKTYADYPFGVLVNDQFDRFSAPIERRFTRSEAEALLAAAGLSEVIVRRNHGWIAEGIRD
jgi:SAM-dependent methyltransferase